jgi:hypothetical protein
MIVTVSSTVSLLGLETVISLLVIETVETRQEIEEGTTLLVGQ